MTLNIAMWSGPRNISTALMRAFENRDDTDVTDEPLYAYYLNETQLDHPGRDEVIRSQSTDWRVVTQQLIGPSPRRRPVWYQKHMTHHLLDEIDRGWMNELTHCFLIRSPRQVLASYAKTRPNVTLEDLGFEQQAEIFTYLQEHTHDTPLVIDSQDVLQDPKGVLTRLCEALDIPFTDDMLTWPAGPRSTDGVWAKHWYDNVLRSTGFVPYTAREVVVDPALEPIVSAAQPHYDRLHAHRLKA